MKYLLLLAFFLLSLSAVSAVGHDLTLLVGEEETEVLHEVNLTQNITITLPSDASSVTVDGEDRAGTSITLTKGELRYTTSSFHTTGRTTYLSGYFGHAVSSVTMILPAGALLTQPAPRPSVSPKPDLMLSNGQQLQLNFGAYDEFTFFLSYTEQRFPWLTISIIGGLVLIALLVYMFRPKKNFSQEHLLPAEQKIVEVLSKASSNILWQKELQIQSGFTKSRVSRTIRALERRGLVKKIPYGNSNKVQLL